MLTDDEARRLLQHAGETVTVDPTRTLPEPPRRPLWPVLVAAAAVVAIAVTSVVIANRGGSAPDPAPITLGPTSAQVPSVLGYRQAEAVHALTDAGFTVTSKPVPSCDRAGFAVGTDPAAGTPLERGSAVVLQVSAPSDGVCIDDSATLARQLLAFADGRGDPPPLADHIEIYDDAGAAEITAAQAADPETWRACSADDVCTSVMSVLSASAHGFYLAPGGDHTHYVSPVMTATTENQPCHYDSGPTPGRTRVRIQVHPSQDATGCTDTAIDVYRDDLGRIDTIALRTLGSTPTPSTPPEDVAHQFDAFARGHGDLPPIGNEVDLYVGGAFTGFVTPDSAPDRKAWETCTEIGTYAGRDCPFSPLDVLRDRGAPVAFVDGTGPTCLARFDHAEPRIGSDSIAIVPTRTPYGACGTFAVVLYVNDDGELIAVDLLLSTS